MSDELRVAQSLDADPGTLAFLATHDTVAEVRDAARENARTDSTLLAVMEGARGDCAASATRGMEAPGR